MKSVFSSADLVLYCEAFLTTYRTFLTPEDLIKKLHYRYPFQCCVKSLTVEQKHISIFEDSEKGGNSARRHVSAHSASLWKKTDRIYK